MLHHRFQTWKSLEFEDLWWNLLDLLCVFIGVVDFAAELLMLTVGMAAFAPLNTLTVIRVLRVVRIIRVVRAPWQIADRRSWHADACGMAWFQAGFW
jgi:hypothetical protein